MADFLVRAKDLYFGDRSGLSHFGPVLEKIQRLHIAKGYFRSDLQNIEEILSILEMDRVLDDTLGHSEFQQFITDVISRYTPAIGPRVQSFPSNWQDFVFAPASWRQFGAFAAALLGVKFENRENRGVLLPEVTAVANRPMAYSVITLNYDRVLESVAEFISTSYPCNSAFGFSRGDSALPTLPVGSVALAKLHGGLGDSRLVPPTWNKHVHEAIVPDWQLALRLLRHANHIRVIGYSLPDTDAYVRYLLKASVIHAEHLKTLHVICLDPDRSVRRRYEEFVDFKFFRFVDARTEDYLGAIEKHAPVRSRPSPDSIEFATLERGHTAFINEHAKQTGAN